MSYQSSAAHRLDLETIEQRLKQRMVWLVGHVGLDLAYEAMGVSHEVVFTAFDSDYSEAIRDEMHEFVEELSCPRWPCRCTDPASDDGKKSEPDDSTMRSLFGAGLLVGVHTRERGGASPASELYDSEVSQVELVWAPVETPPVAQKSAVISILGSRDSAGPIGMTPAGVVELTRTALDCLQAVKDFPDDAADLMLLVQPFWMGIRCGVEIRRLERRTYLDARSPKRRPAAFYLTCGNDIGQRWSSKRARYHGVRAEVEVAAFWSQGAADFPWWPMYSSVRPGDLAIITLAAFDAGLAGTPSAISAKAAGYLPTGAGSNFGQLMSTQHPLLKMMREKKKIPEHVLGVGLVTSGPEWLRDSLPAWQANIGFVRPLPALLDLGQPETRARLASALSRERVDPCEETANLQFKPSEVTLSAEEWLRFRSEIVALMTDSACSIELDQWNSDLDRIAICSENLARGASVESLRFVAPPGRFGCDEPPGRFECQLLGPAPLRGLPAYRVYTDPRLGPRAPDHSEGPLFDAFGAHESGIARVILDRLATISPEADQPIQTFAMAAPATARQELDRVFGYPREEVRAKRLRLPLDPAWSRVRVVWWIALGRAEAFVALLPEAGGPSELSVFIDLLTERRRCQQSKLSVDKLETALGGGTWVSPDLEATHLAVSGQDDVKASVERFLAIGSGL